MPDFEGLDSSDVSGESVDTGWEDAVDYAPDMDDSVDFSDTELDEDITDFSDDIADISDVDDGLTDDVSEETDLSPEVPDMPEDFSDDIDGDVPEDVPEDMPEDVSEESPDDVPEDVTDDASDDIPEDTEDVPAETQDGVAEETADASGGGVSWEVDPGETGETVSEQPSDQPADNPWVTEDTPTAEDWVVSAEEAPEGYSGTPVENAWDDLTEESTIDTSADTEDGDAEGAADDLPETLDDETFDEPDTLVNATDVQEPAEIAETAEPAMEVNREDDFLTPDGETLDVTIDHEDGGIEQMKTSEAVAEGTEQPQETVESVSSEMLETDAEFEDEASEIPGELSESSEVSEVSETSEVPADSEVPLVPDMSEDFDDAPVPEEIDSGTAGEQVTDLLQDNPAAVASDTKVDLSDNLSGETVEDVSDDAPNDLIDRQTYEGMDNVTDYPHDMKLNDGSQLHVIDENPVREYATVQDAATGEEFTVRPNPMDRVAHFEGMQGNNDLGMEQDCGIASTAKSINDLYGSKVIDENKLAQYAYDNRLCEITEPIANSGGMVESNVQALYEACGLEAQAFSNDDVPDLQELGKHLSEGGSAIVAVNSDLLWDYDAAQSKDFSEVYSRENFENDADYAAAAQRWEAMQDGSGQFVADHYVNVSNAVYDKTGRLTHFIMSDTGNGTTKMIPVEQFQRAYNGLGSFSVDAQGCVLANRGKQL